jgi:hypothetical protein
MPKMQVSCPKCRQPVVADVQQLFDVNVDPEAKQRLLSGAYNIIQCPFCGYQGNLSTIIVYHDPQKELLLTFVPPEIGLPRNEQERVIGGLINQVINSLPQEKRKGYLLNPQSTLTMQGLIERILETDGITREMIQAQQQRLSLLQRLAGMTEEKALQEVIQQEDGQLDAEFFMLLSRLGEAAAAGGDRESYKQLVELQRRLLPLTTYGKQLKAQTEEVEQALKDLQAAGRELTREKMLDLLINAPNQTRMEALVSLARPAIDYSFFQLLSERIDHAKPENRQRLVELRTRLLELTEAIDKQVEAHRQDSRQLIEEIMKTPDIEEAIAQSVAAIDELFMQELDTMLKDARKKGDLERSGKLQQIMDAVQKAAAGPEELHLIEEYLDMVDDTSRQTFLDTHKAEINQEFMDLLANLAVQVQSGGEKELVDRVIAANRQAVRFSMQRQMQAE